MQLFESSEGEKLYAAQRRAVSLIFSRRVVAISGPPGTGKTFTLSRAFALLNHDKIDYTWQVATPTCKSTKQLEKEFRQSGTVVKENQVIQAQWLIARAKGALADRRKAWREKRDNPEPGETLGVIESAPGSFVRKSN